MDRRVPALISIVVLCWLAPTVHAGGKQAGGHAAPVPAQRGVVAKHAVHWGYDGRTGPEYWGELSPDYERCSWGTQQSPINIVGAGKGEAASVGVAYRDTPMAISNNGHTIQVDYETDSYAKLGGRRYELKQFHVHSPSENTVNGYHHDMEVHFVHADHEGRLAVLAVFLSRGAENATLAALWDHIPRHQGHWMIPGEIVNATGLLPARRDAWHFMGSLTTPPCSEGVSWFVLQDVVEVAQKQIDTFRAVMKPNNRPPQSLNGRTIVATTGR